MAAQSISHAAVHRREDLVAMLHGLVPDGRVIHDRSGRSIYAVDAFGISDNQADHLPLAVVLPATVREVSQVLRYAYENEIHVFARGGGTSLTGAVTGRGNGIVLCLSRLNRVLEVSIADRLVRVEAGATASAVSNAVVDADLLFAPDHSSRMASTIGGNIATDAGGAGGTRYGSTLSHLIGLKVVLIDGEVIDIGDGELEPAALDLIGLLTGSEGLLGVIVEATLRVVPSPEASSVTIAAFGDVLQAAECANGLAGAGLSISALEIVDGQVLDLCGFHIDPDAWPTDAGAALIVEVEGAPEENDGLAAFLADAIQVHQPLYVREIKDADVVAELWKALDGVFTALGAHGALQGIDIVVPPAKLKAGLKRLDEIAERRALRILHMCRAGAGTIRSLFLYDANVDADRAQVTQALDDIAALTAELGGILGGEHGLGYAKREQVHDVISREQLALHSDLKSAFDAEALLGHGTVFDTTEIPGRT